MARLFWVGTGVVLTVVVFVKGRQVVRRYMPAAVVERAEAQAQATGEAITVAAAHFMDDFRAARDERAKTLADSLLASTQGTVDDLTARRDAARDRGAKKTYAFEDVDPDEDDLGYSF